MKRFTILLVLLAISIAPLAAFAQEEENPLRETDPFWNPTDELIESWRVIDNVEEGAEITFWTMSLSPSFDAYIEKIVENFELAYPEVTVTWEDQPWDSLRDSIRNSIAAGNPADVINSGAGWVAEFAEAGVIMNMDEMLGEAYPDIQAQYSQGAWHGLDYEGASYQIPWYLALSNFLAYNGDILDELGYDSAELPTNWTELYEFAEFVQEASDGAYYAFSQGWGEAGGLGIVGEFPGDGIPVWNEEHDAVIFDTPEAVASLQMRVDLLENGLVPRESLTDDHREMIDRFSEGEIAILMMAPHMLRLVEENNPEVYAALGVAPGITGALGTNSVDIQSLIIPSSTPYPNAALALAVFVTNPEVQAAFSKEVGIYPSNLLSYGDPFFQDGESDVPFASVPQIRPLAYDYVLNAQNNPLSFPNSAEVEQVIREETEAAMLGEKTAQEAITAMQERINEIIAAAAEE